MPTVRTFAYNSGSAIASTAQFGSIAAGATADDYGNGLTWWRGPDEDLKYIICHTSGARTAGQNSYAVASPTIGFFGCNKTDPAFLSLCGTLANQTFATTAAAKIWLTNNGYWTSYLNSYTYYRWQITEAKTMPPVANCVQASEFRFTLNGVDYASMSSATVTNPSGSNPVGEEPPKLVDNNTATKGLDLNFVTNGNVTNFIFQFSSAVGFNGYRWATANDEESRDPKSWTIAGSNDGSTWTTLHTVSGFTATTTRLTFQTAQVY